jgi:hypothetical protein
MTRSASTLHRDRGSADPASFLIADGARDRGPCIVWCRSFCLRAGLRLGKQTDDENQNADARSQPSSQRCHRSIPLIWFTFLSRTGQSLPETLIFLTGKDKEEAHYA